MSKQQCKGCTRTDGIGFDGLCMLCRVAVQRFLRIRRANSARSLSIGRYLDATP